MSPLPSLSSPPPCLPQLQEPRNCEPCKRQPGNDVRSPIRARAGQRRICMNRQLEASDERKPASKIRPIAALGGAASHTMNALHRGCIRLRVARLTSPPVICPTHLQRVPDPRVRNNRLFAHSCFRSGRWAQQAKYDRSQRTVGQKASAVSSPTR